MSGQVNKTDKNDAYGLAQIVKAGWYREVGVKSLTSHCHPLHAWRPSSTRRHAGGSYQPDQRNLKTFGIVLSRRTGEPFERLVAEACGDNDGMLNRTVQSLLCVYSCLKEQIWHLDRQLMGCARTSAVCQQLMTIPGVGVLTALHS